MPKTTLRRALQALGHRTAELRASKMVTQQELAERSGVSLRYLQMVEAAEANVTFEKLVGIAAGLDVELRELFQPHGPPPRRRRGRPRKS